MKPKTNVGRLDAQETAFFGRELEHVKSKTYDIKYGELKARKLIPLSSEAGEGAETISYQSYSSVGMAKIVESYAKDFPRADVKAEEHIVKIHSLGDSYGYSIQEIRNAAKAGKPLNAKKAAAAKRAMMQKENSLALFGSEKAKLTGLFNHPNVPVVAQDTSRDWLNAATTGDQILDDLNKLANSVPVLTNDVEVADTLLMDTQHYAKIASKRIVDSTTTVLKFFMDATPYIKNIEPVAQLSKAGAAGGSRVMVYRRDPNALEMEVPVDFEQFEPLREAMEWTVHCHERFGGVSFYYPLSAAYMDLNL